MKCNDADFLRELGECYQKLLSVGNKKGHNHNPYPSVCIFPTKYFVSLYKMKVSLGIPEDLERKIGELLNSVDAEDFEESMKNPLPMEKRIYFQHGMLRASKAGEK